MPARPKANGPARQAVEQALARARQEDQMGQALAAIMQNPARVTRFHLFATAIGQDGPQPVLLFALPDGHRLEFALAPASVAQVVAGLTRTSHPEAA